MGLPRGILIRYTLGEALPVGSVDLEADLAVRLVPLLASPAAGCFVARLVSHAAGVKPTAHLAAALRGGAIAVAVVALWVDGGTPRGWAGCLLGWILLALAGIDWMTFRLPDMLTLPLLLAGLGVTWVLSPEALAGNAAAAALGFLTFRLVALAYRQLRGREGLGKGDAKLLAVAGAWTGPEQLPVVVLGSAVVGIFCIIVTNSGWSRHTAVPFGPALALSIWLTWIWG